MTATAVLAATVACAAATPEPSAADTAATVTTAEAATVTAAEVTEVRDINGTYGDREGREMPSGRDGVGHG